MDAASDHGGVEVVRARNDVGDDGGIGGIRDGGFEDADDRGGAGIKALEANLFADDRRIFL